jgi:hypothetical protein
LAGPLQSGNMICQLAILRILAVDSKIKSLCQ